MNCRAKTRNRRGAILAMALVTLMIVGLLGGLVMQRFLAAHRQSRRELDQLQAEWLAEAAVARGLALREADAEYTGETWRDAVGIVTIGLDEPAGQDGTVKIIVQAYSPDKEKQRSYVQRTYLLPLDAGDEPAP